MSNDEFIKFMNQKALERGWRIKSQAVIPATTEEIVITLVKDSPPPLGIHVTDGIGSKDKLR